MLLLVKMNDTQLDPQTNEAISAALENNWLRALELNKQLLKKYPDDVDTLNRLARSLMETGNIVEAKKHYNLVLKIDPYNQIAEKNIVRLNSLKSWRNKENGSTNSLKADLFLEEPGKTIVVGLEDIAMPSVLASLQIGDEVSLSPHKADVTVLAVGGQRVGKIVGETADIVAYHEKSGSKFSAFIKSVTIKNSKHKDEGSEVMLFVREMERSPKAPAAPFPVVPSTFTPYVREEAMNLLSQQAPVQTGSDDGVEEIEVSELSDLGPERSLEEMAEKEQDDSDKLDE